MPAFFLLLGFLLSAHPVSAETDPFPQTAAAYLVQVDDRILWSRKAALRLPPASLTKLLTAILVLEKLPPTREIRVSRTAARETGSRLNLREDERVRAGELLAAMLISSANDACRALIDEVAGQPGFVAMMNDRIRQWGMKDTHFSNGCGHDEPEHYSTAQDLAILARKALEYPEIRGLTAMTDLTIATVDGRRQFSFNNTNILLGRIPGVIGLKTGYTPLAGKCLIAYAEHDQHRVLLVMLNAPNRWWDADDIIRLAFSHAIRPE